MTIVISVLLVIFAGMSFIDFVSEQSMDKKCCALVAVVAFMAMLIVFHIVG